jgi:hypothetical protein
LTDRFDKMSDQVPAMIQLDDPLVDFFQERGDQTERDVRRQVIRLMRELCPKQEVLERRHESRYAFPYLIHVTPVADDGITPEGESTVVVGKHISERGLGFYHPKPLPHRRMIVSLEYNGHWLGFLIDLRWTRFTKQGWYESGGRLLQPVPSPIENNQE